MYSYIFILKLIHNTFNFVSTLLEVYSRAITPPFFTVILSEFLTLQVIY